MYIGARDYGTNLDVQWFLTCEPGFLKKISAQIDAAVVALFNVVRNVI
jgi:hypothetical protein